jgi:hypothetical protein
MTTDSESRRELLEQIKSRRAAIGAYVRVLEPRGTRLTNLSIICSAIVTALTAGPALGGTQFTGVTAEALNVTETSLVWRALCFLAMVLSMVAAIATNLYKSHDYAARLAKAEACNVALEGLETLIKFGQLSLAEAVTLYQQYVAEVSFVHEQPAPAR